MRDDDERAPGSLRGRLAAVYFPALLGGSEKALGARLGDRATLYHPVLGAAAGMAAAGPGTGTATGTATGTPLAEMASIEEHLTKLAEWLAARGASYAHRHEVIGIDRDVTEGALSFGTSTGTGAEILPVACVLHRKKERQVDLRVYHATVPLGQWQAARSPRVPEEGYVLARDVAEHLGALRLGDADSLVGGFESDGHLRDGAGRIHSSDGGKLRDFYVTALHGERGANDWVPIVIATADNGRLCAVEYTTEKLRDGERAAKEGLIVFERGESGLFRSVRLYDELGLS